MIGRLASALAVATLAAGLSGCGSPDAALPSSAGRQLLRADMSSIAAAVAKHDSVAARAALTKLTSDAKHAGLDPAALSRIIAAATRVQADLAPAAPAPVPTVVRVSPTPAPKPTPTAKPAPVVAKTPPKGGHQGPPKGPGKGHGKGHGGGG